MSYQNERDGEKLKVISMLELYDYDRTTMDATTGNYMAGMGLSLIHI